MEKAMFDIKLGLMTNLLLVLWVNLGMLMQYRDAIRDRAAWNEIQRCHKLLRISSVISLAVAAVTAVAFIMM